MKKWIFSSVAIVAFSSAAFFAVENRQPVELTQIQLANIEALAEGDTPGDKIPCWSSASRDANQVYVDCASCTRIEGWKGTRTESLCTR